MKKIRPYVFLLLPFFLLSCIKCTFPVGWTIPEEITVLSYNVQNLFDDVANGTEYPEFVPGDGEWTTSHFHTKLIRIADVIRRSVKRGPDIVALQEVENENCLSTLNDEYLKGMRYRYTAFSAVNDSAVHVALLSRFPITEIKTHGMYLDDAKRTRTILEIRISVGEHSMSLFNNHWKSKAGGAYETEPLRIEGAAIIGRRIRQILKEEPAADILVVGDFNENINEYELISGAYQTAFIPEGIPVPTSYRRKSLFYTTNPLHRNPATEKAVLYSCWADMEHDGSYSYRGSWETIDNILLSAGLFDARGFSYVDATVVTEPFLMDELDRPFRWDRRMKTGYSDHLPLLGRFTVQK